MTQYPLAGLDPGLSKCGLVLTDPSRRRVQAALVLPVEATMERLRQWRQEERLEAIVIGNGTGSAAWCERLRGLVALHTVDERGSTLAGRRRYWQLYPERSWRRLLPEALRLPPRDWDDVVAQLLVERWLGRELLRSTPVR